MTAPLVIQLIIPTNDWGKITESFIEILSRYWFTEWKVSLFGIVLVRIFPRSDWTRRDIPYLSVFSPHAGKWGPE